MSKPAPVLAWAEHADNQDAPLLQPAFTGLLLHQVEDAVAFDGPFPHAGMVTDRPSWPIVGKAVQGSPDALQPAERPTACTGLRQPEACRLKVGQSSLGESDASQPSEARSG